MPQPLIARPYQVFSDSLSSYQESLPREQFAMKLSSAITGNAPLAHVPDATAPTGRATVFTTTSSPLRFAGIADTATAGASSGDVVTVVTYGIVRQVVSSGTITAGDGVQLSTAANGTVVTAGTNDNPVIGIAMTTAASNKVDLFLFGTGAMGSGAAVPNAGVMSFPITLANITGAGDVLTNWTPGFAGTITGVSFAVTTAVTTAAKAVTLNLEIGTTNVTGGVVSLTSANCTPLGAVIAGTAVTAANFFTATDTISIEAASVTAFAEGAGVLLVSYT